MDYGCGTGSHSAVLVSLGYEVYGVDINPFMLKRAGEKFKNNKKVHLFNAKQRDDISAGSVDVCILLFDVLSYMNSNGEIMEFLSFVRKVLAKDGLFIFDFWYGPGVLGLGPKRRWKKYHRGDKEVLRLTTPELDNYNCVVNITHEMLVMKKNKLLEKFSELHKMRYFFKNEIELFLQVNGFKIKKFATWNNIDKLPGMDDWSALVVSKPA
jgi:SAM-dependent methyltransferase